MKGLLIVVGKTTDKRFETIINEYVERIRHYGHMAQRLNSE